MAEYIEREKDKYIKLSQALEVLDSCACWWAHERMESIPAADVRPVVLCKDCRSYNKPRLGLCETHLVRMHGDDFCSYGKKREEADGT